MYDDCSCMLRAHSEVTLIPDNRFGSLSLVNGRANLAHNMGIAVK